MKSLSDISTFKYSESIGNSKLSNGIKSLIDERTGAKFITEANLDEVFIKMRHKAFNFAAKFAVIDLFRKGYIRIVYNENVKLTVAIPYFKFKLPNGSGFGIVINITNYAKLDSDGNVSMDPLVLYNLMIAGITETVLDKNQSLFVSGGLVDLYSDLMLSVLARMINLDATRHEQFKYIFKKFMCMQADMNELEASKAAAGSNPTLSPSGLEQINLSCPMVAFTDLETLINHLRTIDTKLESITFGNIFDRWMRSYGEASAFAIESPHMFILLFTSLVTNCVNIVNVKAIEKEANRRSSKLMASFNRMEGIAINLSQTK